MRIPFRHIAGHLVWSTSGSVWAIWRVAPVGGHYVPTRVRDELLGRVTSLVRSLAGAPRLFGLAARVDPGEVAEQMVTGLDWQRLPAWAETTTASLNLLAGQEMHRRTLWLAILRVPKTPSMACELQVLANGRRSADRRVRLIDRAAATALPRRVERALPHTVASDERR